MIAYFKQSETNPDILKKKSFYAGGGTTNDGEVYRGKQIAAGQSYTNEQLIEGMIRESDNIATGMLYDRMDADSFSDVLTDIGLQPSAFRKVTADEDFITAKSYAYLFRLLYNSTYLSSPLSEKALKLLSETSFESGITQGIPSTVVVSHKFGERTVLNPSTYQVESRELHDCGIVYYPDHPYILCVMTKGTDFNDLSKVIGTVSSVVYTYVNKEYSQAK